MASYAVNVREAVLTQAVAALTTYPVCWHNQKGFVAPNAAPWTKFTLIMPDETFRQGLVVRDKLDFMAQVDVYIPKGDGDLVAYQVRDAVDASFPNDSTPLTANGQEVFVKNIGMPKLMPIGSDEDDSWDRYYITVRMYAFVDRS